MGLPSRVWCGVLVLVAASYAVGCGRQDVELATSASTRRAILDAVERYYSDLSARDWDAYASHFWPGATLTTVWRPPGEDTARVVVTGIDEFVARAPEGPGSREIFEERLLSAEVRARGDLAHVWARYEARFGDPGEVMEWRGIDAFTLMRHGGDWRIIALGYTTDDDDAP